MEATMAHVVRHPHHTDEIPSRIYWLAGLGIALIALLLALSATTASNPVAPALLTEPPMVPFIPLL
jgi:hypothetical protein